ncbi:MAG: hypothetical protein WBA13_19760 [Microcoleaceae cyanobacterium]
MKRILLSSQEIEAASQQYGTPSYLYNLNKIDRQVSKLQEYLPANFSVFYTLKANSNLTLCHRIAQQGCGADISSTGELRAAIKAGFSPEKIVFTGPGKTNSELAAALEAGIDTIALESVNEARRLNGLAEKLGKTQNVLIRINPFYRTNQSCEISQKNSQCGSDNVQDSQPKATIQTIAASASKFGVDETQAEAAIKEINTLSHLNLTGIHIFTESNVLDYKQLLAAWQNTIAIANRLNDSGYSISKIDFGGGIGIPYNWVDDEFDIESFGQELQQVFAQNPYPYECMIEMGRYIVGEAGCYLMEVVDIKQSLGQTFIIVDGGVHQLLRTSMKKASRYMEVLGKSNSKTQKAMIGGKLPTPLDIMVEDVDVPVDIEIGDRIVIYNCGAYGFNHSLTNFALHPYPAEIAYCDGEIQLIRERGNIEDFFLNQPFASVEHSEKKLVTPDLKS